MRIYTEITGNINSPDWRDKVRSIEYVELDQWTAQKSRFVISGEGGREYGVALKRHSQLLDGDILEYTPSSGHAVVVRIALNKVMVVNLDSLRGAAPECVVRVAVEVGHAIGNQHWPAVVKGTKVYVPLTVDGKVMESVMRTHHLEGVEYSFIQGSEVIPYLAPHEIRRLFGGAPSDDAHHHDDARHDGGHCHDVAERHTGGPYPHECECVGQMGGKDE